MYCTRYDELTNARRCEDCPMGDRQQCSNLILKDDDPFKCWPNGQLK